MPGPRLQPRVVNAQPIVGPAGSTLGDAVAGLAGLAEGAMDLYALQKQKDARAAKAQLEAAENAMVAKAFGEIQDIQLAVADRKITPVQAAAKQKVLVNNYIQANPQFQDSLRKLLKD